MYRLYGTFSRKPIYVTDIDINNILYKPTNPQQKANLIKQIHRLVDINTPNLFFTSLTCGKNEQFVFQNNQPPENILHLKPLVEQMYQNGTIFSFYYKLLNSYFANIESTTDKHIRDKSTTGITDTFLYLSKIRWNREQVKGYNKVDNKKLTLDDCILDSPPILHFMMLTKEGYYVPIDVAFTYKGQYQNQSSDKQSKSTTQRIQDLLENEHYFYALQVSRRYYKNDPTKSQQVYELVEKKYGNLKHLMIRLYHLIAIISNDYLKEEIWLQLLKDFTTEIKKEINKNKEHEDEELNKLIDNLGKYKKDHDKDKLVTKLLNISSILNQYVQLLAKKDALDLLTEFDKN
jgi:hypothetical protein